MFARPGDRIVIRSDHLGGSTRDGEVIGVEDPDGAPPYHVRWSDTGHESLIFPGPDANIDREGHQDRPAPPPPASPTATRPPQAVSP